jgi:hypothetical protein
VSVVNQIWNRACFRQCERPRAGDKALAALLLFHSAAMNGGIDHAIESLGEDEVREACTGYRYFGFDRIATMIADAKVRFPALPEKQHEVYLVSVTKIYSAEAPMDSSILERFERHLAANSREYAPIA